MATSTANEGNYYYGARYYNPQTSVWLSVDLLAHEFPWQSPYAFTDNNPVNLVDPDGRSASPVFNEDGYFLGTTESGYKGEILIMDAKDFKQGMKDSEAMNSGAKLNEAGISNQAIGQVLSHVANHVMGDGLDVEQYIDVQHDPDYVDKYGNQFTDRTYFQEVGADDKKINVVSGNGWRSTEQRDAPFESTVENLRNSINEHEAIAHGNKGITGQTREHYKAYLFQIMHPQWSTTTPAYQETISRAFRVYSGAAGNPSPKPGSPFGRRLR